MSDGSFQTGIIVEQNDDLIRLRKIDGQEISVNKQDVEVTQLSKQSSMPEGQAGFMSKQELADLVEYLFMAGSSP